MAASLETKKSCFHADLFHSITHPYIFVYRRYAETQTGTNGERYRDWLCVYASDRSVERCRLDGHLLEISEAYETCIPWKRILSTNSNDCAHSLIHVRSSVPIKSMEPLVTTKAMSSDDSQRFQEFSRGIRTRMLQDFNQIPLRDAENHFVERGNLTVYTNSKSDGGLSTLQDEVLIVYSPSSIKSTLAGVVQPQQLEFISFVLP